MSPLSAVTQSTDTQNMSSKDATLLKKGQDLSQQENSDLLNSLAPAGSAPNMPGVGGSVDVTA